MASEAGGALHGSPFRPFRFEPSKKGFSFRSDDQSSSKWIRWSTVTPNGVCAIIV